MRQIWQTILAVPSWALISAAKCYQLLVSPWLGPRCRFQPTCSVYFIVSVQKYGAIRGGLRGLRRLCRCHPFHPGGYDPP